MHPTMWMKQPNISTGLVFFLFFKNEIPGFSLEERTVAEYWWSGGPVRDPWRWRIAIAKRHDVLYGKFFAKKAGFISEKMAAGICQLPQGRL